MAAKDYQMLFFCEKVVRIFFKYLTGKMKIKLKKSKYQDQYFQSQHKKCTLRIPTTKSVIYQKMTMFELFNDQLLVGSKKSFTPH